MPHMIVCARLASMVTRAALALRAAWQSTNQKLELVLVPLARETLNRMQGVTASRIVSATQDISGMMGRTVTLVKLVPTKTLLGTQVVQPAR